MRGRGRAPGWPRGGAGGPAHPPADAVGDGPVPGGDDLFRVVLDEEFRALPRPQLPEQQAKVRERARGCRKHPDLGTRMWLSPTPTRMTPNGAVCRGAGEAGAAPRCAKPLWEPGCPLVTSPCPSERGSDRQCSVPVLPPWHVLSVPTSIPCTTAGMNWAGVALPCGPRVDPEV